MYAYDYETQQWVSGAEAVRARSEQIAEEVAVLESADAARYLRMIGSPETVQQALSRLRAELRAVRS